VPRAARASATAGLIAENGEFMELYCGIDWAEDHHDIAVVGRDGQLLGRRRIGDDAAGLAALLGLLAEHGDSPRTRSRWRSRRPAGC
jgi:hypothetical protein